MINKVLSFLVLTLVSGRADAQPDTLRVMTYNVLYYGDTPPCQDAHNVSHNYMKIIAGYTSPDVLGLIKMEAYPVYTGDHSGNAPNGFPDSILQYALNAAFPGRYAYCPSTNTSTASDMSVLFYNQQKLGYAGIVASYVNITDFDTYKLYYKSADLATTHDTIFLYVTLNHTNSGSNSSDAAIRATQIAGEMNQLATHFTSLPNIINMGDFNTHNSTEACYQRLVNPSDAGFRYYDPPFFPDAQYTYPADWDTNPASYAACLTTSTRQSGSVPNSCGTSGGGKSWYDHIFLSSSIINNTACIGYVPHSYKTFGNDGNRTGISVNDAPVNTAAPTAVIDALFHMSNKYPVTVQLAIEPCTSAVVTEKKENERTWLENPVKESLAIHFPVSLIGRDVTIQMSDISGRALVRRLIHITKETMQTPCNLSSGTYQLQCSSEGETLLRQMIVKD